MKTNRLFILAIAGISMLFFCANNKVAAQAAYDHLPYLESFEDTAPPSDWVLNAGPSGATLTNRWCQSSVEHYVGKQSLLISNDGGQHATYTNTQTTAVAYKIFTLPAGTYDLSFSWRCKGEGSVDGLYVLWVDASQTINSSIAGKPSVVNNKAIKFGTNQTKILNGSDEWKTEYTTVTVKANGAQMKLAFVWDNDGVNNYAPAVSIDNVQICRSGCGKPANLNANVNGTNVVLSWTGSASSYQVQYRAYGQDKMSVINNVSYTQVTIPNLPEGVYDFFVRGVCPLDSASNDTTVWYVVSNKLIYNPASHCINFTDLQAPTTFCTTGVYANPYQTPGVKDFGPESILSSHTTHWRPGETDPRTNGKLRTVPEGEVMSVRLGNWEIGAKAESVTYTYTLAPNEQIIMLIKYACVLEAPGHGPTSDPVFSLEILDESGVIIDARCGKALFTSDVSQAGTNGWTLEPAGTVKDGSSSSYSDILWKDWSTVGMNLSPYAGQTIKIRLTTKDCDASGHFGYGYYVLSCSPLRLSGLSCGEVQTINVKAPDGFNYEWYKPSDPGNILFTTQELQVDGKDTATYNCDVVYKNDPGCRFTLSASLLPRYPLSQFSPRWQPKDCENKVLFRNTSGVMTEKGMTGEKCETTYWTIMDTDSTVIMESTEDSPEITFGGEGDTILVRLRSGISDDQCTHDTVIRYVVPPVRETRDTTYRTTCRGNVTIWNGNRYTETGIYEMDLKSFGGCDSIVWLNLTVVDKVQSELFDTICSGDTCVFNNNKFTRTGDYKATYKTKDQCDSLVTLHLHVFDQLAFTYTVTDEVAGPGTGAISLENMDSSWTYTVNGVANDSLEGLSAGTYTIVVYNEFGCQSAPVTVTVDRVCLDVRITDVPSVCADGDSVRAFYEVNTGFFTDYSLRFEQKAIDNGFVDLDSLKDDFHIISFPLPEVVRPDKYKCTAIFNDPICGPKNLEFEIYVKYPDTILQQKFNDVIAIKNSRYNGGFEFDTEHVIWYKNGVVDGTNTSTIYYIGPYNTFDLNDQYHVALKRLLETEYIESCVLPLEDRSSKHQSDVIVQSVAPAQGRVHVSGLAPDQMAKAQWWTVSGHYMGETAVEGGPDAYVITPGVQGVYLLRLVFDDQVQVFKVLVR